MATVTMHVELVSPERVLFSGEATMVILRTLGGGDIAFLPGHAPFLGALTEWTGQIHLPDGTVSAAAVHAGFVQVNNNSVSILADAAWPRTSTSRTPRRRCGWPSTGGTTTRTPRPRPSCAGRTCRRPGPAGSSPRRSRRSRRSRQRRGSASDETQRGSAERSDGHAEPVSRRGPSRRRRGRDPRRRAGCDLR